MSLGGDADSSKAAFVAAMQARLEAKEEGLGDNVNDPEVKANLEALGQAVYNILTQNAETVSSAPTEPDEPDEESIWAWIQAVHIWIQALHAEAIAQGFNNLPTPPTIVPTQLRGRIE